MMPNRLWIVMVLVLMGMGAMAQERPDSIGIGTQKMHPQITGFSPTALGRVSNLWVEQFLPSIAVKSELQRRLDIPQIDLTPGAALWGWDGGGVVVAGNTVNVPGLMGIESGQVGVVQTFGNLTLTGGLSADKYGYYGGLNTVYGVNAAASYRFSDRVSVTIFGNFYNRNLFMSAAMMPYVAHNNFGGFVSVKLGGKWGVDAGAQGVYDPWSRGYRVRPMVMPYYEISPGNKLGVDVGGILYELLRDKKQQQFGGGAVIGPPIPMGPAPLPPHE